MAVAQTRRVLFAKQLIQETRMPMAEVALAAGFGSIRRFNETFQALYRRPPTALRRLSGPEAAAQTGVTLRLRYRAPYDWAFMLGYLRDRTIAGVDAVEGQAYRRTVRHDEAAGLIEVRCDAAGGSLAVTVRFPDVRALPAILTRVKRLFDVDADVETIGAHLSRDPFMAPLVAARPGLRTPGAWDGFELAVRAVLGQQVSVQAARRLAARLVQICGEPLPETGLGLTYLFPTPAQVAAADLSSLGMPGARRAALGSLAEAALSDPALFQSTGPLDEVVGRLRAIKGVGEWTAQYIALRALRETDAFPATDVGLLRGAAEESLRPSPAELTARAEAWRPWRAYAAQHLWAADPLILEIADA